MKIYYLFKYWMRDVAIVRGEFGVFTSFINEAGWIILLLSTRTSVDMTVLGVLYSYLWGLIILGFVGRFLRNKKIPEVNNTLQNELNAEMQTVLKDLKLIKERLGIK